MRVVVPFAAEAPKTRLADTLDADERESFAWAMLQDVLVSLRDAGREPTVLATAPIDVDVAVVVDDRPLTPAVNAVLDTASEPVAVVMADLALATPASVSRFLSTPGDVVLTPGRAGGTNAFVTRHSDFRVDYHGTSYLDHLTIAREVGASVFEFDSHRLATDVDERADLVEVLLHGEGRAREWLIEAGFELDISGGRVDVTRSG